MTNYTKATVALLASIVLLAAGYPGVAAAQDETNKDLRTVTCKDVLLASGEERDGIVLVLHAYLLGEAKQTAYNSDVLGEATDAFLDACIENPGAEALGMMRKKVSAGR